MPDDTITAARRQPGDAGDPAGYWSRWINPDGTPDGAKLDEIVRGIVSAVRPDRIVLFGSAARGAMKSGSDLDLLVVKNVSNLRELSLRVRDSLPVDRPPVDVLAATPELVAKHGDSLGWVLRPAVEEGTTVYEKSSGVETADGRGRRSRRNGDEETNRVMVRTRRYKPEEALDWLRSVGWRRPPARAPSAAASPGRNHRDVRRPVAPVAASGADLYIRGGTSQPISASARVNWRRQSRTAAARQSRVASSSSATTGQRW